MISSDTTKLDPKQVIEDKIRTYVSRKRPCEPNLDTIEFLKARIHPHDQLYYVSLRDTSEQEWLFSYFLSRLSDGSWYIVSGNGGQRRLKEPTEMQHSPSLRIGENKEYRKSKDA